MIFKEIRDKGFDAHFFINGLASYFRDLMVAQSPDTLYMVEAGDDVRRQLAAEAAKCSPAMICRAMSLLNDADLNYRNAANKQFLTELTLAKICQLSSPSPSEDSQGEGQRLHPIAVTPQAAPAESRQPAQASAAPAAPPVHVPSTPPAATQPSAQTHHIPAATPRPAQPRPVNRPASIIGGIGAPRINTHPSAHQPQSSAPKADTPRRTSEYDDAALITAWDRYMADHPTETILVHTMRACKPHRTAGDTWMVTVENAAQRDKLTLAPTLAAGASTQRCQQRQCVHRAGNQRGATVARGLERTRNNRPHDRDYPRHAQFHHRVPPDGPIKNIPICLHTEKSCAQTRQARSKFVTLFSAT